MMHIRVVYLARAVKWPAIVKEINLVDEAVCRAHGV